MSNAGQILIADDEDLVLQTTAALLEAEGFDCDCASNVQSVHEMLSRKCYDLLITDWQMSGNANLELVQAIHDSGRDIPVIVVTGYPRLLDVAKQHNLRMFAYVVKPFEFEEFLQIVRDGMGQVRGQNDGEGGTAPASN